MAARKLSETQQIRQIRATDLSVRRVVSRVLRLGVPIAIAAAFVVPLITSSALQLQVFSIGFLNAAVVAPLVLSLGYLGLLNLSQATFYGLGAYTVAILVTDHGWGFGAALLAGVVVAGIAGAILATASARVEGDYFVLVSLGVTIAVAQALANLPDLTRGREGFFGLPEMSLLGLDFSNKVHVYYLCLALLAFVYFIVHRMSRSFTGRSMLVLRYDELAARSLGISPLRTRVFGMVISSAFAGLAGGFLVGSIKFITPADFAFDPSFMMSLYVIIGGMASLPGAVLVAFGFTWLNEQARGLSDYSVGIVGIAVLIAVFIRGGVVRDAYQRLVLKRRRRNEDA
ncbi:branched-chain amino acid ABC transporter permease [Leucobacter rhizosphaerae]|uniref:Branched-chain amino acid ABC transporter permease n=1 Tax=Leucobacter rhizosphaerae TaxID=2932245 RepID=A0ABY4FU38_9MICO|nr:branched-chain amino acid ABC transporter permease [Leucobacter rhizosphaerae]UOQ59823.1 branched-chain amino acid ABC transporter permease [Leucobacter rhizosphaerae]